MAETAGTPEHSEDRRRFIKRLAYVAPVVETFLLKDAVEAQADGSGGTPVKDKKPKPSKPKPK
jgi:hypothetical protein